MTSQPQSPPAGDEPKPPNSGKLEGEDVLDKLYSKYWHSEMGGQEFKSAIRAYILAQIQELIGEDEPLGDWREVSAASNYKAQYINLLRAELRQAATARFGGKS